MYYGFGGNFTRMECRRGNYCAFYSDNDDNSDYVLSEWECFEKRRIYLINHYVTMVTNHTLNCNLKIQILIDY